MPEKTLQEIVYHFEKRINDCVKSLNEKQIIIDSLHVDILNLKQTIKLHCKEISSLNENIRQLNLSVSAE